MFAFTRWAGPQPAGTTPHVSASGRHTGLFHCVSYFIYQVAVGKGSTQSRHLGEPALWEGAPHVPGISCCLGTDATGHSPIHVFGVNSFCSHVAQRVGIHPAMFTECVLLQSAVLSAEDTSVNKTYKTPAPMSLTS